MEYYKKYGRSSWAKHLRKNENSPTKRMANKKSRAKSKSDLESELNEQKLNEPKI